MICQVYQAAEARYYEANQDVKRHNDEAADGDNHSPFTPLSFGTPNLHEGTARDGRRMSDLKVWELLTELSLPE